MRRKSVLYLEVAEQIRGDILNGKYPIGSLLPTESELEKLFDVSKITIRRAIELLAAEELLEKKSGKGTTVLSNQPYNRLSKAGTFTEFLKSSGQKVEKKSIGLEQVSLSEESEIFPLLGASATKLSRLYTLEGLPYIFFEYYLSTLLSDVSLEVFNTESLYRLLDQHGIEIVKFQDSFQLIQLTPAQQKILNTAEATALKRIRKSFNSAGNVVEYSEAIYNTSVHPYVIEYEA